jgi:hypothetical protein
VGDALAGALHDDRQRHDRGLTIHYQLATTGDQAHASKVIQELHQAALDLPFQHVGEIVEFQGDECDWKQRADDDPSRWLLIQAACPGCPGRPRSSWAEDEQPTSSFNEDWLRAVVSIEQFDSPTNAHPLGTGFLLATTNGHIALVTAKHVVLSDDGTIKQNVAFRFNEKTNRSALVPDIFLSSFIGNWVFSNDSDLASRLIAYSNESDISAIPIDHLLPQKHVRVTTPILVLGFPMGLRSEKYSTPIARRGIVARSGSGELMLDAFVFPGNSGGPVVYTPVM